MFRSQPLKYSHPLSLLISRIINSTAESFQLYQQYSFGLLYRPSKTLLSRVLISVYHGEHLRNPQKCVFFGRLDFCYTERQQTMMDVLLFVLYSNIDPWGFCRLACQTPLETVIKRGEMVIWTGFLLVALSNEMLCYPILRHTTK